MTYDEIVQFALTLPEVEESLYYQRPAVKRGKRAMFALKEDGENLSLKLDWDNHDRLLKEHPEFYFKTPHYEGWPWFLVRFEKMSKADLRELVRLSWEDAPFPARRRK